MIKLYLDDIRSPSSDDFIIVRSFEEAVSFVKDNGVPDMISFDHDLGVDENDIIQKTGYDFAKWLVKADMKDEINIPIDFTFNVHSADPIGSKNIEEYLKNYFTFKNTIWIPIMKR